MTEATAGSPGHGGEAATLDRRRIALRIVGRTVVHIVGLVGAYYLMPIRGNDPALALRAAGSLGLLLTVLGWQVRLVLRADYPFAQGIIGLSLTVPLMVVLYAGLYLVTSTQDPAAFSEPLGRTDALYFAMTVLSTVGFGDISPSTDWARILSMTQMVATIVILGFAANTVFNLAGQSRPQQDGGRS